MKKILLSLLLMPSVLFGNTLLMNEDVTDCSVTIPNDIVGVQADKRYKAYARGEGLSCKNGKLQGIGDILFHTTKSGLYIHTGGIKDGMFHGKGISQPNHKDFNGRIITAFYTKGMLDGAIRVEMKYSGFTIDGAYLEGKPVGPFIYDEGDGKIMVRIYNQGGIVISEYTSEKTAQMVPTPMPREIPRPMDDAMMLQMQVDEEQRELDMIRANMPTSMVYSPPVKTIRYKKITPEEKMMVIGDGMGSGK